MTDLMALPEHLRRLAPQRGHVSPPETGPRDLTCRDCAHLVALQSPRGGRFYKCGLNRQNWSQTGRTDVFLKDAACRRFTENAP